MSELEVIFYGNVVKHISNNDFNNIGKISSDVSNYKSDNHIDLSFLMSILDYPVYGKNGIYLGDDGRSGGGDLAFVGEIDNKKGFTNLTQFTDKHSEFQKASNVIKHESSGSAEESLWIAHTANNAQKNRLINWKTNKNNDVFEQLMDQDYSTTSVNARKELSIKNNSINAMNSRAALIDVLLGCDDTTGGAVLWDGFDFLHDGFNSNKFYEYGYVRINSEHLKKLTEFYSWQSNKNKINANWAVQCIFETYGKIPHHYTFNSSYWTGIGNKRKYYQGIRSSGTQGGSVFWQIYKR